MLDILRTIVALIVVQLLGAALLWALGVRARRFPLGYAQPALDFAVGAAMLAVMWTCAAPLGWHMTWWVPCAAAILLGLVAKGLSRRGGVHAAIAPNPSAGRASRGLTVALLALLTIVVIALGWRAYSTTMYWDARYIWAFKAKAMFIDGRLDRETFTNLARYRHTAPDHPIALPAAEALVYQFLGHVDERCAKLVDVVYWAGLTALIACYLRRRASWHWSLAIAALVSSVPILTYHASGGAADVPAAFCFLAAGVLLAEYADGRRIEDGVMSALMFGVGAATKSEGLTMAIGGAVALAIAWRLNRPAARPSQATAPLGAIVLPPLPWLGLRALWHIGSPQVSNMALRPLHELVPRLQAIASGLWAHLTDWPQWEATWPAICLGFVAWLIPRGRPRAVAFLWAVFLWQIGIDMAVYMLNPYDIQWTLAASLDRLLLQLMPLGLLAAACSVLAAPAGEG